jgi:hypothetical protein
MKILYHAQGKTRKELADAISTITGAAKVYQGIPSYAYEIDCFTVDRDGNLNFDDSTETKDLLEKLDSMGFHADPAEPIEKEPDDSASKQENIDDLVIAMPRSFFTDTALENLKKLIQAKSNLMLKVFQTDVLRMQVTEDKVLFPWFTGCPGCRYGQSLHPFHYGALPSGKEAETGAGNGAPIHQREIRLPLLSAPAWFYRQRIQGRTEAAPAAPFRFLGL